MIDDAYTVGCPLTSLAYCKQFTIYNTGVDPLNYSYRICDGGYDYGTLGAGLSTTICATYADGVTIDSGDGYSIEGSLCTSIVYL